MTTGQLSRLPLVLAAALLAACSSHGPSNPNESVGGQPSAAGSFGVPSAGSGGNGGTRAAGGSSAAAGLGGSLGSSDGGTANSAAGSFAAGDGGSNSAAAGCAAVLDGRIYLTGGAVHQGAGGSDEVSAFWLD